jgi:hypothetical protein
MPAKRIASRLAALQAADSPSERLALALDILEHEAELRAVRAAVDVVAQQPTPQARPRLLARYAWFAENGVRRDPGTLMRVALLHALRPLATHSDTPLLEQAAATYEYLPPGRSEEASPLRSAALVVLAEVDPGLATGHAVRLLADPETSRLSGEPALTAVRVLAAQGQLWPLYLHALTAHRQPGSAATPEVVAECLRCLADGLPDSLAHGLLSGTGGLDAARDEALAVGLIDLALARAGQAYAFDWLKAFLRDTRLLAAYRYAVTQIVVSHHPPLLAALAAAAAHETDRGKQTAIREALALGGGDPAVEAVRQALDRKAGQRNHHGGV